MLLLANAAGLAFVPHLPLLLGLAEGMLLSEEAYSQPGLLPAVGRLANASVALLGPDYTFGSHAYLVCKAIINDMRALEAGGCRGARIGLLVLRVGSARLLVSLLQACFGL